MNINFIKIFFIVLQQKNHMIDIKEKYDKVSRLITVKNVIWRLWGEKYLYYNWLFL